MNINYKPINNKEKTKKVIEIKKAPYWGFGCGETGTRTLATIAR